MNSFTSSSGRWCAVVVVLLRLSSHICIAAFSSTPVPMSEHSPPSLAVRQPSFLPGNHRAINGSRHRSHLLRVSTIDVEVPKNDVIDNDDVSFTSNDALLSWKDIFPLSIYTAACLLGALVVSTYEDYDVTHVRPNPSTLRPPTSLSFGDSALRTKFDFVGAATRGMGWGPAERGYNGPVKSDRHNFFEEWYGTSAATLQWKPSYNEVMLQHRSERVPRWNRLENENTASANELQHAVLQLYRSLDELDELKVMADDYRWDEMRERLDPAAETKNQYSLPVALEYSMDVLKSTRSGGELSAVVGFDWGSCAWRHCGAKADAQEALAELQSDVGMLEPFECRFVIDIAERSIRDVLAVVPTNLKPYGVQARPYEAYIPKAGNDGGMGVDYEYEQALSEVRVDLSLE